MTDKTIYSFLSIGLHTLMAIGGLMVALAPRTALERFAANSDLIKVYGSRLGKIMSMKNEDGSYASQAPATALRITGILVAAFALSLMVFIDFA